MASGGGEAGEGADADWSNFYTPPEDLDESKRQSISLRPVSELLSENTTTLSKPVSGTRRESVASSYIDEDDSDTTSCNEEDPMSYDDYMDSRRSSEYTNGSYADNNRQSVDFADAEMYNSLARKFDSVDNGKKKKWRESRGGEDSGNGTDWKSESGSISGAKFIQTPICDHEDDDEMELSQSTWDIFQTIPRERKSNSETSLKILKFIKVLMYGFLFIMVLGTAVMSKISFIVLATNTGVTRLHTNVDEALLRYSENAPEADEGSTTEKPTLEDLEIRYQEIRNSAVSFLLFALIIPEALVFLSHTFKSLFGSQPWPTMRIVLMSLIVGALETFGHCLLVFKVLPTLDIVRGVMLLSCVGFLPGVTRLVFGKESKTIAWQIPRKIMLIIAVVLQLTGPVAVLVFSYGWKHAQPSKMDTQFTQNEELNFFTREPAKWTIQSLNQLAMNWEVILAVFLTNLSWCENFLERNVTVFGKNINVCKLKAMLHSVRQKTYAFLPLWKIMFMFIFVYAMIPNYNISTSYKLDLQQREDPKAEAEMAFEKRVNTEGEELIEKISDAVMADIRRLGHNGHKNISEAIQKEMEKIYVAKDEEGIERHPKQFLDYVSDPQNNIARALNQMVVNIIETGDTHRYFALETLDGLLRVEIFSSDTERSINDFKKFIKNSDKPGQLVFEIVKQGLEEYWTFILLIISTMACSYFAKLSCKLCMQWAGFAVPLMLAAPVTVVILYFQCEYGFLPGYSHWICVEQNKDSSIFWFTVGLGVLWWISQMIIVSHVWIPCKERLARTDKLFVVPGYSMSMVEQSLLYNRRRNDGEVVVTGVDNQIDFIGMDSSLDGSSLTLNSRKMDDERYNEKVVPRIIAVATMWHETRYEMTQLLKSIFRMDSDHSARRNAQKYFGIKDPDYYEFEAHILFDDALEFNEEEERVPNAFVVMLCEVMDMAASSVHETAVSNPPPVRIPTPYGGQLKWTLPGGTVLTAHIKDKDKIRHKKRWSQVMYMYYLLGYKMICEDDDYMIRTLRSGPGKHISWAKSATKTHKRRKTAHYTKSDIFDVMGEDFHVKSENTFLLTLDGDVDFKPDAVRLLMDRMKKNKKVGAACGRIHPIGAGPIIWFQLFEYACGHWLQKAAEHVFGCVLCAPGCFSLFRGSALMDDNVMNTYTTVAAKASEFVQYDQGEDRWLCTLILQQGYRVEYCAASDALTFAPEEFNEFYNQRRRWGPSTMANTVDLLSDSGNTVMVNDNISRIFLLYQFLVFASSVLGPATVLLMTAGAYHTVFRVTLYWSYFIAIIPPAAFVVVCLVMKAANQLIIAAILSAFYAIIMMIVLVGTAINFVFEGWTSPNVIFVMLLISVFAIGAVLHPQEFACMLYGPLYFLCIPSGYLLLIIYFLCNMNNISWGTREVQTKKTKAQLEQIERDRIEAERKKEKNKLVNRLGITKMFEDIKDLFGTMTGMRGQVNEHESTQTQLLMKMCTALDTLPDRINGRTPSATTMPTPKKDKTVFTCPPSPPNGFSELRQIEVKTNTEAELIPDNDIPEVVHHKEEVEEERKPKRPPRDDLRNPAWLEDERLGDGQIKYINKKEAVFWRQLISRYLYPITMDKEEKKQLQEELKSLRNNVVFAFFMLNVLWIVVVFQFHVLQTSLNQDLFNKNGGDQLRNCSRMVQQGLFIPIPRTDGTCVGIEPLSFIFLSLFTIILTTQFIGMLVHRWGTFLHLIAITQIKWPWSRKMGDVAHDTMAAIELVTQLQKVRDLDPRERYQGDTDASSLYSVSTVDQSQAGSTTEADSEIPVRPRTRRPKRTTHLSLDRVFRKRFHKLKKELEVEIATDAESSNEGADGEEEPQVGNKVYRTVRQRMVSRRTASFHHGQRKAVQRRSSVDLQTSRPKYHDI